MPIRITGMASGLDIDKLVSDMMKAERMPLDKLKQKQTTIGWKTDLYREVNTSLSGLRTTVGSMRLSGDWKAFKATSTNESVMSATASGSASASTHTFNVVSLAGNASMASSSTISNVGTVGAVASRLSFDGSNNQFDISLNGDSKTITLNANYADNAALIADLQSKLDTAFGGNVINVSDSSGTLKFESNPVGGEVVLQRAANNNGLDALGFTNKLDATQSIYDSEMEGKFATPLDLSVGSPSFAINGVNISYSFEDSLQTIMKKVNASAAGVTMSYDSVTDKVLIVSKNAGTSAQVKIESDNGGLLESLGFTSGTAAYGTDMKVEIDGLTTYRSSNTFTWDGVTYTAKAPGSTTVAVNADVDTAFNKIKDFVTKYNETVDLLNKRLKESKFKDYAPLTDEQRADMKDSDITLWETKAKSGLLQNDSILQHTLSTMRALVTQSVDGVSSDVDALYKIGIDTYPYDPSNPQNAGKLRIDETKLRDMLAANPEGVSQLFTNVSSSTDGKGIANRLYSSLDGSIQELIDKSGGVGTVNDDIRNDLGSQMNRIESQIKDFQAKLAKKEDFYYLRFSAMESAIQKSNSQLSWLQQSLG